MNERGQIIISDSNLENTHDFQREFPRLSGLPESVRDAFLELPVEIQERIFPAESSKEESSEWSEPKRRLEEIVSCLSVEDRERFLMSCFSELFSSAGFKDIFHKLDMDFLLAEIFRFLEIIWKNRGKRGEEIEVFNQEYYDDFLRKKEDLIDELGSKKAEIDAMKLSIEKTRRKKRLTEQKNQQLGLLNNELAEIENRNKNFDNENSNSSYDRLYWRGVLDRQKKEKEWTEGLTVVAEYYDADEFAVASAKAFEELFSQEVHVAEGNPTIRPVSKAFLEKAKAVTRIISDSVENWHLTHGNEASYKTPVILKNESKIARVIDYLKSVMESYLRQKNHYQRPEEELLGELRQMEVCLRVLKKGSEKVL